MGILAMESIVLDSASRVRKRGSLQLQGNHDLTLSLCTSNNSSNSAGSSSMPGTPVGVHRGYRRSNSGQQISVICTQNDQALMCNRSRSRASTPGPTSMTHSRSQQQLQSSSGGQDMVYMTQGGAVVTQGGASQRHSFGGSGQWMYMPRGLYYNGNHPSGRHSVHSHRASWLIGELAGLYQPASPLKFHQICGDNVELNSDASIAKRGDSFCKAICFSNRPIAINEKVYIKFAETSSSWSGVLRFGFTNIDPGSLRGSDLPRYACPDMTNKQGNWAKALAERYATPNNTLHFYVTRNGDVFYGVNGEDVGLFFTGVNTQLPLWALFDIYGNTLAVEFANPEPIRLNNMVMSPTSSSSSSVSANRDLASSLSSLSINSAPNTETPGGFPAVRYYANLNFTPLKWHMLTGKNVQLSADRVVATRSQDEYCNGYVFSSRPLKCGEKVVIQVLGVDRSYVGGLGVGLTACNPSRVQLDDLPDDSDLLLDRPEYWVVNKDVCRSPDVGDELCFHLSNEGELKYSRNNQRVSTLLHVDRTLPLWIFFDVYGNVQKIRPLGKCLGLATERVVLLFGPFYIN
ncbi:protein neuralized-like isoform X2 [Argopecten irradians]|uniref:protein neuralized-like isoform X2 n=1 Tax=Argopecten irradians TaxID=31199 RepID=UPI0037157AD0